MKRPAVRLSLLLRGMTTFSDSRDVPMDSSDREIAAALNAIESSEPHIPAGSVLLVRSDELGITTTAVYQKVKAANHLRALRAIHDGISASNELMSRLQNRLRMFR